MTRGRLAALAAAHARELLRRRLALGMLLVLPATMYLTVLGEEASIRPGENPFTLRVGIIGVAWTLAGSAFFLSLSSRHVDERLLLAGYRRSELAAGRLLFLAAITLPVIAAYSTLITMLSGGDDLTVVLAIAATGVIAVGLGLSLAAIVHRELEGLLALIAVIGVQTSIPTDATITPVLPFYGPTRLVVIAWDSTGDLLPPLLHSAVTIAVLLTIFLTLWGRGLTSGNRSTRATLREPTV